MIQSLNAHKISQLQIIFKAIILFCIRTPTNNRLNRLYSTTIFSLNLYLHIRYFVPNFIYLNVLLNKLQWGVWEPLILQPFFAYLQIIHPRSLFAQFLRFENCKNDDALDVWNRKDVFSNANYKSFETFIVLNWSLK